MGVDWATLRTTLVRVARNRGWPPALCEDGAQDAIMRALEQRPVPKDLEAYAMQCLKNMAVPREPGAVEAEDTFVSEARQHAVAVMSQQLFVLRVAVTLSQLKRSSQEGGAARIARLRTRRAVVALVGKDAVARGSQALGRTVSAPPGFKSEGGGRGAGSPHAGRGRGKKEPPQARGSKR